MLIFERHVKRGLHFSIEWFNGRYIIKRGGGSWHPDDKFCTCSFCDKRWGTKIHYGLNLPKGVLSSNGWYVLKIWKYTYIRFNFINLGQYANVFFK